MAQFKQSTRIMNLRDYRSGDNKVVHSAYNRESVSLIGTLTPTQNTALELDIDLGRGNASYADRAMDARTFDKSHIILRISSTLAIPLIALKCGCGGMRLIILWIIFHIGKLWIINIMSATLNAQIPVGEWRGNFTLEMRGNSM